MSHIRAFGTKVVRKKTNFLLFICIHLFLNFITIDDDPSPDHPPYSSAL